MKNILLGSVFLLVVLGIWMTLSPRFVPAPPPQPTSIHRDLALWKTTPAPTGIPIKPANIVTIPAHSVVHLKYFTVDNQSDLTIDLNTTSINFVMAEFIPEMDLQRDTDRIITFVFTNDVDFDPSTAEIEQIKTSNITNRWQITVGLGFYVESLSSTDPDSSTYINGSISYLMVHGLTQMGIDQGTYSEPQADKIRVWYINQTVVNPGGVLISQEAVLQK